MSAGPIDPTSRTPAALPPTAEPLRETPKDARAFTDHVAGAQERATGADAADDASIAGRQQRASNTKEEGSEPIAPGKRKSEGADVPRVQEVDAAVTDDASVGRTRDPKKGDVDDVVLAHTTGKRLDEEVDAAQQAQDADGKATDVDPDDKAADVDEQAAAAAKPSDDSADAAATKSADRADGKPAGAVDDAASEQARLAELAQSLRAETVAAESRPAGDVAATTDAAPAFASVRSYRAALQAKEDLNYGLVIKASVGSLLDELVVHLRDDRGWAPVMDGAMPVVLALATDKQVVIFAKDQEARAVKPVRMVLEGARSQLEGPDLALNATREVASNTLLLGRKDGGKDGHSEYFIVTVEGAEAGAAGKFVESRRQPDTPTFYDAAVGQIGKPGEQSYRGDDLRLLLADFIENNRARMASNNLVVEHVLRHVFKTTLTAPRQAGAEADAHSLYAGLQGLQQGAGMDQPSPQWGPGYPAQGGQAAAPAGPGWSGSPSANSVQNRLFQLLEGNRSGGLGAQPPHLSGMPGIAPGGMYSGPGAAQPGVGSSDALQRLRALLPKG